ncbi:hypothetical protein FSP39_012038 [Pinctada imbricata]|uniref:Menin n=1 Tax=Pinctada imbricata TaxID=66713 RepID=A0AA89BW98_PINIB|nr:hypothetical protein FSP39_012038 [Pinctada imbricata]
MCILIHIWEAITTGGATIRKPYKHGLMLHHALKNYNYNREDEEIYKEFLDIANNIIPHMMKQIENDNAGRIHHTTILYDPESYANFLRFYDGICEWEEDSPTPVLHITWAKQLVFSLGKFDASVRGDINLKGENGEEEESGESESDSDSETENKDKNQNVTDRKDVNKIEEDLSTKSSARGIRGRKQGRRVGGHTKRSKEEDSTEVNGDSKEEELKSVIEELESKVEESSEKEPIIPVYQIWLKLVVKAF